MRLPRTLVATAAAALAVTGITAGAAVTSSNSATADVRTATDARTVAVTGDAVVESKRLGSADAVRAASAALAAAEADGAGFVSVSVVDRNGQLQAFVRGENAASHTISASRQKAYTAAAFGSPTSELAKRATGDNAGLKDLPGTLFLAGAVPVKAGEASIGGIGVGGTPSGATDQEYAQAGLDAITK
ncbi:GlcG/HbpS family heme-binding protein [Curtobacterium flaccumfaciens]|uniref:GlcG/HbpS family heme-binding protein n=1 Tax=Curtobacterium flaccumfaciens TaxID=2035 RepID=UPI001BDE4D8F|nr:heme-binding protein [Curtobacterium flaccumfaciens]MBT1683601.1 heme-binding protein [Curtobacterium flaccumfaciens pv. flaccumfaciens]